MTADTTTPLLDLLLQGTGNNNNAWGQNLNDHVISRLDNIIAGAGTVNVTTNPYTLTDADLAYNFMILSGSPVADQVIIFPDLQRRYIVLNHLGNGFFAIAKTDGAGVFKINLPVNKYTHVLTYGSDFIDREDYDRVGELFYFAGTTAPYGSLECTGAALKRASAIDLFSKIGTTYGLNDGTDFKLPDGYTSGKFLRSRTASVAIGTPQSNQNKSHTHTGSGTTSGASVGHTHTGSGTSNGVSVLHTHTGSGTTSVESADHTHTFSGTTAGESATHTHTTAGLGTVSVTNGGGASQGNLLTTSGGTPATIGPSNTESVGHTHTYSGTTSGISATHTHTYSFTTSTDSVDHTHSYSFTTSGVSADHTHTYSFTTSTGSADGTEARPESLVGMLCIRY